MAFDPLDPTTWKQEPDDVATPAHREESSKCGIPADRECLLMEREMYLTVQAAYQALVALGQRWDHCGGVPGENDVMRMVSNLIRQAAHDKRTEVEYTCGRIVVDKDESGTIHVLVDITPELEGETQ